MQSADLSWRVVLAVLRQDGRIYSTVYVPHVRTLPCEVLESGSMSMENQQPPATGELSVVHTRYSETNPSIPAEQLVRSRALRTSFEVVAGLIPGQPMPEYTKQWHLADGFTEEEWHRAREEAYAYARTITNPHGLNWVHVDWIWY